jgi:hypothetical protein
MEASIPGRGHSSNAVTAILIAVLVARLVFNAWRRNT